MGKLVVLTREQILRDRLEIASHNLYCCSANYLMTIPKEGQEDGRLYVSRSADAGVAPKAVYGFLDTRDGSFRTIEELSSGYCIGSVDSAVTSNYIRSNGVLILLEVPKRPAGARVEDSLKVLLSFDGKSTWYSFKNGLWTKVATGPEPMVRNYRYDPFGVELGAVNPHEKLQNPDANPFRYCGEYFDLETNTYYLRARNYDPMTSRMLSEDTVRAVSHKMPNGQEIVDPLSLNLYTYCWNNPNKYRDPSGNNPVAALLYSPPGQQVMQQIQVWANQAGVSVEIFIANNMPTIQQLINQVGQAGPAAYDYISSGQAQNDFRNSVRWVGDRIKSSADFVGDWVNKNFGGGGGSASPGDPNNWNRRDYYLKQVENAKLKNAVSELYRPTASIGDGGTADALRNEVLSGGKLTHLQKSQGMIKHLNDILRTEKLTDSEAKLARMLLNDLYDAVKMTK